MTTDKSNSLGVRERNKQDKLERIQKSAWMLFREHGFAATTTRAVAEAAGVATGTVFLYAKDKPALLALAFENVLAQALREAVRAQRSGQPVADRILHLFQGMFQAYEQDQTLAREFVRAGGGTGSPAGDGTGAVTRELLEAVESQLASEPPSNEHAHFESRAPLALQCLALYSGTLTLWLEGWLTPGEGPDEALRRGIAAILGGSAALRRPPTGPRAESPFRPGGCRPSRGAGIFGDHDDFVD